MPAEKLVPDSTVAAGTWTGSSGGALHSLVCDQPANSATFIQDSTASSGGTPAKFTLSNPGASVDAGLSVALCWTAQDTNLSAGRGRVTLALKEGAVTRATAVGDLSAGGVWESFSVGLSGVERASVVDWSALQVEASCSATGIFAVDALVKIGDIWLEVWTGSGSGSRIHLPLVGVG